MSNKSKEVAAVIEALQMNGEEIVDAIDRIDNAMHALASGKLSEKALFVLLAHQTQMSQQDVKRVINALADLKRFALK